MLDVYTLRNYNNCKRLHERKIKADVNGFHPEIERRKVCS